MTKLQKQITIGLSTAVAAIVLITGTVFIKRAVTKKDECNLVQNPVSTIAQKNEVTPNTELTPEEEEAEKKQRQSQKTKQRRRVPSR